MGYMPEFDASVEAVVRRQQEQIESLWRVVECLNAQLLLVLSAVKEHGAELQENVSSTCLESSWLPSKEEAQKQVEVAKTNGESG